MANLDPQSGQDIMALVDRIHQEQDATTIIIEHRLEDVFYERVDRVVLFSDGQIIYNGEPDQLLKTNFYLNMVFENHCIFLLSKI